jgi:hypothetical protein
VRVCLKWLRINAEVHAGRCSPRTSNPVGLPLADRSVRLRHTSATLLRSRSQSSSCSICFFLCFGGLRLSSGCTCEGGGVPTASRASRFTSLVALNGFGLRRFAMPVIRAVDPGGRSLRRDHAIMTMTGGA